MLVRQGLAALVATQTRRVWGRLDFDELAMVLLSVLRRVWGRLDFDEVAMVLLSVLRRVWGRVEFDEVAMVLLSVLLWVTPHSTGVGEAAVQPERTSPWPL
jgi:hypothetical protein